MPDLESEFGDSHVPVFLSRVDQAIVSMAMMIGAESHGVPFHDRRKALASTMLSGGRTTAIVQTFAQAILSDGIILYTATDADLLTRLEDVWNGFCDAT